MTRKCDRDLRTCPAFAHLKDSYVCHFTSLYNKKENCIPFEKWDYIDGFINIESKINCSLFLRAGNESQPCWTHIKTGLWHSAAHFLVIQMCHFGFRVVMKEFSKWPSWELSRWSRMHLFRALNLQHSSRFVAHTHTNSTADTHTVKLERYLTKYPPFLIQFGLQTPFSKPSFSEWKKKKEDDFIIMHAVLVPNPASSVQFISSAKKKQKSKKKKKSWRHHGNLFISQFPSDIIIFSLVKGKTKTKPACQI